VCPEKDTQPSPELKILIYKEMALLGFLPEGDSGYDAFRILADLTMV
jgi:hypothetical protein